MAESDLQRVVTSSVIHAVTSAQIDRDPFTHALLHDVFPPQVYDHLLRARPALSHFTPDNPGKYGAAARRFHGGASAEAPESCRYILPLNDATTARLPVEQQAVWSAVSAALHSTALKDRIFARVADDLCRRFRVSPAALLRMPAHPRPTLIRDLSGYWIAPHPDSPAKIVTAQLYLPTDDSQRALGTTFYRRRLFNPRILLSLSNLFEPVRHVPFLPNSGYLFPVSRRSWHGRAELPGDAGERNSILLVYYGDPSRVW